MKIRIYLALMIALLAGGMLLMPVHRVSAQTEEAAETQDDHARGLGSVIIIVGVLTVAGVGAVYMMRQQPTES